MAMPVGTIGRRVGESAMAAALREAEERNGSKVADKVRRAVDAVESTAETKLRERDIADIEADIKEGATSEEAARRASARVQGEPVPHAVEEGIGEPVTAPESDTEFHMTPEEKMAAGPISEVDTEGNLVGPASIGEAPPAEPVIPEDAPAEIPRTTVEGADIEAPSISVHAGETPAARSGKAGKTIAGALLGGAAYAGSSPEKPGSSGTSTTSADLTAATEQGRQQARAQIVDEASTDIADSVKKKLNGYVPESIKVQTVSQKLAAGERPPELSVPQQFQDAIDNLSTEGKRYEQAADGKGYAEKLSDEDRTILHDWAERKQQLQSVFQETKDRLGWAEAISMLGGALAKLGAGLYGIRTGVNMSGLQFDYHDWSKDFARNMDEYKLGLDEAESTVKQKQGEVESRRKEYDDWRRRMEGATERAGHAQLQTEQFNVSEAQKASQADRTALLQLLMFNAKEKNDAATKEFEAGVKESPEAKSLTHMQQSLAQGMFSKDYADWEKSQSEYAAGLGLLKEGAAKGDKTMVRQGLDKVSPYLKDPSSIADLQEKAQSGWWIFKGTDPEKLIGELRNSPKKDQPAAGEYLPGGRNWPTVMKYEGLIPGGESSPAPAASPTGGPPPSTQYKDGDKKNIGGHPYVRRNGKWIKQ